MNYFLGVDSGGTFTDFVLLADGKMRVHKVLSTPNSPELAILQGVDELGLSSAMREGELCVFHGTTVATNAALEKKGAKTLFVTNKGFEDMLFIARQNRQSLYELEPQEAPFVLGDEQCVGVAGRIDSAGRELEKLDDEDVQGLIELIAQQKPDAIAVCFLFSYLQGAHEQQLAEALADALPSTAIHLSHQILPVQREYERAMVTWLNAYLGPKVERYLSKLAEQVVPSELWVMQSSGDLVSAPLAASRAASLLLSGPAGGLQAVKSLGARLQRPRLLGFDMGGTSTDVAVVHESFFMRKEAFINDWPVSLPMVDMHTIGAGGGSMVSLDAAGVLHVGPESASASPGPVCYDQGAKVLTVTDAHVLLGHIQQGFFKPAGRELAVDKVHAAFSELGKHLGRDEYELARGILDIANEKMAQALRFIALQKGLDVREHSLVCFGGAGGLHACDLAEALEIGEVIVPDNSGVFSALGMLLAEPGQQFIQGLMQHSLSMAVLLEAAKELRTRAEASNPQYRRFEFYVELRYEGQEASIELAWAGDDDFAALLALFHKKHEQRYGHALDLGVEAAQMRLHASHSKPYELAFDERREQSDVPRGLHPQWPVLGRYELAENAKSVEGPLIIRDATSTVVLKKGWQASVSDGCDLILQLA